TLLCPPKDATDIDYDPLTHFSWSSPYAPGGFRFSLGTCPLFDLALDSDLGSKTTIDWPKLKPDTLYCWKIVGVGPDGSPGSVWQTSSFLTKAAAPPPSAACKPLAKGSILVTWPAITAVVGNPVTVWWTVEDNDPPIAECRVHVFVVYSGGGMSEYAVTPTYAATAGGDMAVTLPYWLPANVSGTAYAVLVDGRTSPSCSWYPVGGSADFFVSG